MKYEINMENVKLRLSEFTPDKKYYYGEDKGYYLHITPYNTKETGYRFFIKPVNRFSQKQKNDLFSKIYDNRDKLLSFFNEKKFNEITNFFLIK